MLRCNGENDGCCTSDQLCDEGDGDCDSDDQCSGSLICGVKNCAWENTNDDCCVKKPGRQKRDIPKISDTYISDILVSDKI